MQVASVFIGVDASKAELVYAIHGQDVQGVIANEPAAVSAWLQQMPATAAIAVESTGPCHQLLAQAATAHGLKVFVLNARDVFFYAKGLGARGKTDRVDARVIARYLAEHHASLHPFAASSPAQAEIDQLLAQRWTVVTKRTALRQCLHNSTLQASAELDTAFGKLLAAIDERIQRLIGSHEQLRQAQHLLESIVGVGQQSGALLASLLTRVPFATADALVAYSGLDPRPHDSGRTKGKRRLSKRGSPALRRQMYLAAMAASHSKAFGPLYKQLRDRGLKTTEALVVLARKLLRIAFAVWKSGQPFDSRLVAQPA